MDIECPECNYLNKDIGDELPELACDSTDFECGNCYHEFKIGWIAEVELR